MAAVVTPAALRAAVVAVLRASEGRPPDETERVVLQAIGPGDEWRAIRVASALKRGLREQQSADDVAVAVVLEALNGPELEDFMGLGGNDEDREEGLLR